MESSGKARGLSPLTRLSSRDDRVRKRVNPRNPEGARLKEPADVPLQRPGGTGEKRRSITIRRTKSSLRKSEGSGPKLQPKPSVRFFDAPRVPLDNGQPQESALGLTAQEKKATDPAKGTDRAVTYGLWSGANEAKVGVVGTEFKAEGGDLLGVATASLALYETGLAVRDRKIELRAYGKLRTAFDAICHKLQACGTALAAETDPTKLAAHKDFLRMHLIELEQCAAAMQSYESLNLPPEKSKVLQQGRAVRLERAVLAAELAGRPDHPERTRLERRLETLDIDAEAEAAAVGQLGKGFFSGKDGYLQLLQDRQGKIAARLEQAMDAWATDGAAEADAECERLEAELNDCELQLEALEKTGRFDPFDAQGKIKYTRDAVAQAPDAVIKAVTFVGDLSGLVVDNLPVVGAIFSTFMGRLDEADGKLEWKSSQQAMRGLFQKMLKGVELLSRGDLSPAEMQAVSVFTRRASRAYDIAKLAYKRGRARAGKGKLNQVAAIPLGVVGHGASTALAVTGGGYHVFAARLFGRRKATKDASECRQAACALLVATYGREVLDDVLAGRMASVVIPPEAGGRNAAKLQDTLRPEALARNEYVALEWFAESALQDARQGGLAASRAMALAATLGFPAWAAELVTLLARNTDLDTPEGAESFRSATREALAPKVDVTIHSQAKIAKVLAALPEGIGEENESTLDVLKMALDDLDLEPAVQAFLDDARTDGDAKRALGAGGKKLLAAGRRWAEQLQDDGIGPDRIRAASHAVRTAVDGDGAGTEEHALHAALHLLMRTIQEPARPATLRGPTAASNRHPAPSVVLSDLRAVVEETYTISNTVKAKDEKRGSFAGGRIDKLKRLRMPNVQRVARTPLQLAGKALNDNDLNTHRAAKRLIQQLAVKFAATRPADADPLTVADIRERLQGVVDDFAHVQAQDLPLLIPREHQKLMEKWARLAQRLDEVLEKSFPPYQAVSAQGRFLAPVDPSDLPVATDPDTAVSNDSTASDSGTTGRAKRSQSVGTRLSRVSKRFSRRMDPSGLEDAPGAKDSPPREDSPESQPVETTASTPSRRLRRSLRKSQIIAQQLLNPQDAATYDRV